MRGIRVSELCLMTALCALSLLTPAAQAADQGITGKKLLIKNQRKTVIISKDPTIGIVGSDPTTGGPSTIRVAIGTYGYSYDMPAGFWSGSGGLFKYKNAATPPGIPEVKIAKLKSGFLKVVAKASLLAVPVGPATVDVELTLSGATNKYCMSFTGTGNGDTFLVKNATAGECPVCGDGIREGTETCDIADDDACPFECQSDCTCPACGDNQTESTEQCDGTDDGQCPGLCLADCTCNPTAEVCCEYGGTCGGSAAGICIAFGGTAIGGGLQCSASGNCGAANTGSSGGCCETSVPQQCGMPYTIGSCAGTYHPDSVCLPSGTCAPACEATTGGFCWFTSEEFGSCAAKCSAVGRVYDDATRDFAGSAGTDANCIAVLDDLFFPAGPLSPFNNCGSVGCAVLINGDRLRCVAPPTDATSIAYGYRACACK